MHQFFAHFDAFGRIVAENSIFMVLHRIVGPAIADTEVDAAATKPVDRADHMSDQDGVSERGQINSRA